MENQPDIVVVDKEQRKAVVVDIAIPSDFNIRKKEHEKLEKYQGPGVGENLEGEGISGARGHWGTRGSDPQTGGVAPADPRKYIRHLGPEKCSSRNSKDTAQNPQAPRPLVEDPSLEEKEKRDHPRRVRKSFFFIYIYIYVSIFLLITLQSKIFIYGNCICFYNVQVMHPAGIPLLCLAAAELESNVPADFLELFMTDELLQHVADKINLYAGQYFQARPENLPHSRGNSWSPVSRYLQYNNNESQGSSDKMYKVRPVLDYVVQKFKELHQPGRNLCVDEGMMQWRGRLSFRVYNPQNPVKYGIKSYILCDSTTCYCFNMRCYVGEASTLSETMLSLLDRLPGHGYTLYMDNFYNSVALCERLLRAKTNVCGTLRKNREEPKIISDLTKTDLVVGERVMRHIESVMVVAWQDEWLVKMVTTCHQDRMQRVEVWQRGQKTKVFQCVETRVSSPQMKPEFHLRRRKLAPCNSDPHSRLDKQIGRHKLQHLTPTSRKSKPTRRCRVCVRKGQRSETQLYCKACCVPLHPGECFTIYHS
uniref:PiggyBac transposable element-derived protein domain-containing protein n=1 Tax=Gouania willdenowi TaxID=441366 RepID=A0A8C5DHN0_GOUWI